MDFYKGYYAYERFMVSTDTALIEVSGAGDSYNCAYVDITDGLVSVACSNWNFIANEDDEPADFKTMDFGDLKSAKDSPYFPFLMEAAKLLLRNVEAEYEPRYYAKLKRMIEEAK